MVKCINCKNESPLISGNLGICADCIINDFSSVKKHIEEVHSRSRIKFNLPTRPPRDGEVKCNICVNECKVPQDEKGYCGLRLNQDGKLVNIAGTPEVGFLSWYYDPLPTNCVADWVCPGHYAIGYKNLAVFYHSCTFNCLFCQNWHFREEYRSKPISSQELASCVDKRTFCTCYFGGDPTPQLPHALEASRLAIKERKVRICWETNGSMNQKYLEQMINLSIESGGCIKFDLKTYTENLNIALCGVSNKRTLENFEIVASRIKDRPQPPPLIASTLLVPGYIDVEEVYKIASFIANLNPDIPYSLLGFYPHFYINDLPCTSGSHACSCLEAAKEAGLKNVHIGNIHLLGTDY